MRREAISFNNENKALKVLHSTLLLLLAFVKQLTNNLKYQQSISICHTFIASQYFRSIHLEPNLHLHDDCQSKYPLVPLKSKPGINFPNYLSATSDMWLFRKKDRKNKVHGYSELCPYIINIDFKR